MNLDALYSDLHGDFQELLKISLSPDVVTVFFTRARNEELARLQSMNMNLSIEDFKAKYVEIQQAVNVYDDIVHFITKLKPGDTQ